MEEGESSYEEGSSSYESSSGSGEDDTDDEADPEEAVGHVDEGAVELQETGEAPKEQSSDGDIPSL